MRDKWVHVGRPWTNGEQFLAVDAALRGAWQDLFDLVYGVFIAKDIAVDRAELMSVFLRKTIFGSSPGAARSLLFDLPLDIYRGWWHKVLVSAASRMSFDAAVETLRNGVMDLFAPYAVGGRGELGFYLSHLRNPIMEAGAGRKLIKVTYHGVTRIMEPYSLVFKRRISDGLPRNTFTPGTVPAGGGQGRASRPLE